MKQLKPVIVSSCIFALGVIAGARVNSASAEPQPHMRTALEMLEKAKDHLKQATADKGGHRVKAIALTDEAIEQVKKGIAFDNADKGNNDKDKDKGDGNKPKKD